MFLISTILFKRLHFNKIKYPVRLNLNGQIAFLLQKERIEGLRGRALWLLLLNTVYLDLLSMGINDVSIIGVGKDAYNDQLEGMVNGRVLPWVEDTQDDSYPVWEDYNAVQRSTYFLDRESELIYQTNITSIDPESPEDYESFINLILNFRSIFKNLLLQWNVFANVCKIIF